MYYTLATVKKLSSKTVVLIPGMLDGIDDVDRCLAVDAPDTDTALQKAREAFNTELARRIEKDLAFPDFVRTPPPNTDADAIHPLYVAPGLWTTHLLKQLMVGHEKKTFLQQVKIKSDSLDKYLNPDVGRIWINTLERIVQKSGKSLSLRFVPANTPWETSEADAFRLYTENIKPANLTGRPHTVPLREEIAFMLRYLRKTLDLSQRDVARLTKIDRKGYGFWETAETCNPFLDRLGAVVRAFGRELQPVISDTAKLQGADNQVKAYRDFLASDWQPAARTHKDITSHHVYTLAAIEQHAGQTLVRIPGFGKANLDKDLLIRGPDRQTTLHLARTVFNREIEKKLKNDEPVPTFVLTPPDGNNTAVAPLYVDSHIVPILVLRRIMGGQKWGDFSKKINVSIDLSSNWLAWRDKLLVSTLDKRVKEAGGELSFRFVPENTPWDKSAADAFSIYSLLRGEHPSQHPGNVPVQEEIAFMLRHLRKRQGLSKEDAAQKTGLQIARIGHYENPDKSNLTLQTLFKVMDTYGLKPEAVVRYGDRERQPDQRTQDYRTFLRREWGVMGLNQNRPCFFTVVKLEPLEGKTRVLIPGFGSGKDDGDHHLVIEGKNERSAMAQAGRIFNHRLESCLKDNITIPRFVLSPPPSFPNGKYRPLYVSPSLWGFMLLKQIRFSSAKAQTAKSIGITERQLYYRSTPMNNDPTIIGMQAFFNKAGYDLLLDFVPKYAPWKTKEAVSAFSIYRQITKDGNKLSFRPAGIPIGEEISFVLRYFRNKEGFSQQAVSRYADCTRTTVGDCEKAHKCNPLTTTLFNLMNVFNLKPLLSVQKTDPDRINKNKAEVEGYRAFIRQSIAVDLTKKPATNTKQQKPKKVTGPSHDMGAPGI